MRRFATMFCAVTLSISSLAGCCWTQRGAAVGGLAGAGIGGVWAHNVGKLSGGEGALVGLAAGGLAGALIGDLLEHKCPSDMERETSQLQKELEALREQLKDREKQLEGKDAELRELRDRIKELEKEIDGLRKKLGDLGEEIKVRREGPNIVLTILGETLYASGKAELTPKGKEVLDRVMRLIRREFPDREIMVRGHTDSQPIKFSGWPTNWELSAARALGVLRYLTDKHGVKGENISGAFYSYYRPVESNATAEGRRQNRRAEIVILPKRKVELKRHE